MHPLVGGECTANEIPFEVLGVVDPVHRRGTQGPAPRRVAMAIEPIAKTRGIAGGDSFGISLVAHPTVNPPRLDHPTGHDPRAFPPHVVLPSVDHENRSSRSYCRTARGMRWN